MDASINTATTGSSFSSISNNAAQRTEFLKYGYYKVESFIYNILIDGSIPPKALMPNFNSDLVVLFINTNACYNRNVGLMKEAEDVGL